MKVKNTETTIEITPYVTHEEEKIKKNYTKYLVLSLPFYKK